MKRLLRWSSLAFALLLTIGAANADAIADDAYWRQGPHTRRHNWNTLQGFEMSNEVKKVKKVNNRSLYDVIFNIHSPEKPKSKPKQTANQINTPKPKLKKKKKKTVSSGQVSWPAN